MAEPDREAYEAAERLVREASKAEEAARRRGGHAAERLEQPARARPPFPDFARCSRSWTRRAARSRPSSRASSPTRCASC